MNSEPSVICDDSIPESAELVVEKNFGRLLKIEAQYDTKIPQFRALFRYAENRIQSEMKKLNFIPEQKKLFLYIVCIKRISSLVICGSNSSCFDILVLLLTISPRIGFEFNAIKKGT